MESIKSSSGEKSSVKTNLFREIGQRSAFSSSKIHNYHFNMITPEKPKNFQKEKLVKKIEEGPFKSVTLINTNNINNTNTHLPLTSTCDKTRRYANL